MDKVVSTIVGIVAAVGLSALVFIGVNKLFDLTENRFPTFNALVGGISTLIVFLLLWGNGLIVSGLVVTLIATAIGAATGFGLGVVEKRWPRLGVGLGGGLALGLLVGSSARSPVWPDIDLLAGVIGLAVGAALGGLLWLILARGRSPLPMLFLGLAVGWLLGGWMAAEFTGSKIEMLLVAAVLGLLAGAWVGSVPFPSKLQRAGISLGSRKYIFLGPALLFIFATLVLPLARTIWLGFLTGSPTRLEFSGLANYARIFADPNIIDFSDWPLILQSKLFWAGVLLALLGIAVAF